MAWWKETLIYQRRDLSPSSCLDVHTDNRPFSTGKRRRPLDCPSIGRATSIRSCFLVAGMMMMTLQTCLSYTFTSAFSMFTPKHSRIISMVPKSTSLVQRLQLTSQSRTFDRLIIPPQKHRSVRHMLSSSSLDDSVFSTSTILPPYQQYYHCLFDMQVPEGRCVGLQFVDVPDHHPHSIVRSNTLFHASNLETKHWLYDFLHPDEIQYGLQLHHQNHRQSFWIGRLAIRHALQQQQSLTTASLDKSMSFSSYTSQPNAADSTNGNNNTIRNSILKDMYGRPQLPDGILGSISHKGRTGVALVRRMCNSCQIPSLDLFVPHRMGIGVDLEDGTNANQRRNVARKVLTPGEISKLGTLAPVISKEEEILLRFSLKESVYKAMHPLICQYVSFQEAEIQPHSNGSATVELSLKSGAHEAFNTPIVAHWYRHQDYFVTTASVQTSET